MTVEALAEAIDGLAAVDDATLAGADVVVELHRLLARLESVVTRSVGAFDAATGWTEDGARSAAAWIGYACAVPPAQARQEVRRGRALRSLPAFAAAWAGGRVTGGHVDLVAAVRNSRTEAVLGRDEALLCGQATRLRFPEFVRAVRYWEQHADPDGTDEAAERRRCRRSVSLAQGYEGTWHGRIQLDDLSGLAVANELDRLERLLFEADWAGARDRLGREPVVADLARTPQQRRADALVEMAVRSGTAPEHGRRPEPLFSVFVGYETLRGRICQSDRNAVVSPAALVPWMDQAHFERVVFRPSARVEVSETARLFTGATRRAIECRDLVCTHPTCDEPAVRCEMDHVLPWAAGGRTTQENGRSRCRFHNVLEIHRPGTGDPGGPLDRRERPPPDAA